MFYILWKALIMAPGGYTSKYSKAKKYQSQHVVSHFDGNDVDVEVQT